MSQDLQVAFGKQCRMQRRQTKLIASRAILFWGSLVSLWAFTGFSRGFLFLATAGRHQMKGTRDVAHPGRIFYACSPKDEGASECKSKGKIVGQP